MLSIICHGRYEVLKASVHGAALGYRRFMRCLQLRRLGRSAAAAFLDQRGALRRPHRVGSPSRATSS